MRVTLPKFCCLENRLLLDLPELPGSTLLQTAARRLPVFAAAELALLKQPSPTAPTLAGRLKRALNVCNIVPLGYSYNEAVRGVAGHRLYCRPE